MDVKIGLIIRLLHIIGSSLFMLFLLLHFSRGYYRIISINSGSTGYNYTIGLSILFLSLIIILLDARINIEVYKIEKNE